MQNPSKVFAIITGLAAFVFTFAFIVVSMTTSSVVTSKSGARLMGRSSSVPLLRQKPAVANTSVKQVVNLPLNHVVKQTVFVK